MSICETTCWQWQRTNKLLITPSLFSPGRPSTPPATGSAGGPPRHPRRLRPSPSPAAAHQATSPPRCELRRFLRSATQPRRPLCLHLPRRRALRLHASPVSPKLDWDSKRTRTQLHKTRRFQQRSSRQLWTGRQPQRADRQRSGGEGGAGACWLLGRAGGGVGGGGGDRERCDIKVHFSCSRAALNCISAAHRLPPYPQGPGPLLLLISGLIRKQMAWQPWSNNGHRNDPSDSLAGAGGVLEPMPPPSFQGELSVRCEEIRTIAADNTLVLEDILGLMQELSVIEDKIHMLTKQTIPRHHADNEREYRDIIQGGMKLEEDMHALELIKEEVLHLSSEKMELEAVCKELSLRVQSFHRELEHIQFENRHMSGIRAELHALQEEILRARMAYDYEKRAKVELLEQSQAIERDFTNMKMEAQRLQAELEKRRSGVFRHHAFGSYYHR